MSKGKRTARPKSDSVASILRPHKPDGIMALADRILSGDEIGIGLINGCLMSADDAQAEYDAYNKIAEDYNNSCVAAEKAGQENPKPPKFPSITPIYDPVVAEAISRLNCRVAAHGQKSKTTAQPDGWNNKLGKWLEGRKIDNSVRVNHTRDLRKSVIDPDKNILKIGTYEYLVGNDDSSAVFLARPSRSGNYAANIAAAKQLSFNDFPVENLVARFNNSVVSVHLDDGTDPGSEVHFLPNQVVTWGYLELDGKQMTCTQIRKAVENSETGIRFVELKEPIRGTNFTKNKFVSAVQRIMKLSSTKDEDGNTDWDRFIKRGDKDKDVDNNENIWRNFLVQMRVNPMVWNCFGFENLQWGIVPINGFGESLADPIAFMVIGVFLGTAYKESRTEARLRISPPAKTAKTEEPQDVKSEKPKKEKKKSVKKADSQKRPKKSNKPAEEVAPESEPISDIPSVQLEVDDANLNIQE